MKYIFTLLVATLAIVGTASAATGSTSTGTTSTGSTSTGTTYTGSTSTGVVAPKVWGGGASRALNFTTGKVELVPQCFPWVWLLEYYKGSIFDMYRNQEVCRAKRLVDFGL